MKKITTWVAANPLKAVAAALVVGVVLATAFARFIPMKLKQAANSLPGSDAKQSDAS